MENIAVCANNNFPFFGFFPLILKTKVGDGEWRSLSPFFIELMSGYPLFWCFGCFICLKKWNEWFFLYFLSFPIFSMVLLISYILDAQRYICWHDIANIDINTLQKSEILNLLHNTEALISPNLESSLAIYLLSTLITAKYKWHIGEYPLHSNGFFFSIVFGNEYTTTSYSLSILAQSWL